MTAGRAGRSPGVDVDARLRRWVLLGVLPMLLSFVALVVTLASGWHLEPASVERRVHQLTATGDVVRVQYFLRRESRWRWLPSRNTGEGESIDEATFLTWERSGRLQTPTLELDAHHGIIIRTEHFEIGPE